MSKSNSAVSCRFEKRLDLRLVSLRSVSHDLEIGAIKRGAPNTGPIQPVVELCGAYVKQTFHIEGVGSVTHFLANRATLNRPNGPNDLFQQLQVTDFGLRRYPLHSAGKCHKK